MDGAFSHRPPGAGSAGPAWDHHTKPAQTQAQTWTAELSAALKAADKGKLDEQPPKVQSAFARLTGWNSTPTQSVGKLNETREALKGILRREVEGTAAYIDEGVRHAFLREVNATIDLIFGEALAIGTRASGADKVSRVAFQRAVVAANHNVQDALIDFERKALASGPKPDAAPQAPQFFLKPGTNSVQVVRKAPTLENLVLRGGGAKGLAYGPALVEMEKQGLLGGLKHVVGTSAGALTATCLAAGFTATEFAAFSDKLGTDAMTRNIDNFGGRYPSVALSGMAKYSGQGALEVLDHASATSVADCLNANWNNLEARRAGLTDVQRTRLETLRHPNLDPQVDRTDQMISFGDLRLLHQLDPGKFRELTVTGLDAGPEQLIYFDADQTPDIPIAIAGRISMALPGVFKGVEFDPKDGQLPKVGLLTSLRQKLGLDEPSTRRKFVDGGLANNLPTEVITAGKGGRELEEARARTAVLVFDEAGKAHDQIYSSRLSPPVKAWKAFTKGAMGLVKDLYKRHYNSQAAQASRNDKRKPWEAGVNTFVVYHGNIKTDDLEVKAARVGFATRDSELRMLQQVRQRDDQLYAVEYTDARHCFQALSQDERISLVNQGEPVATGKDTELYRFEKAVYDMALESIQPPASPLDPANVQEVNPQQANHQDANRPPN